MSRNWIDVKTDAIQAGRVPAFGPSGRAVFERTYSRTKADGTKETWWDTVNRVVDGNLGLVDSKYIEDDERQKLVDLMYSFKILPAGRHLWASGVPGSQYLTNCFVSHWTDRPSEHYEFSFMRAMEGGGVGTNYSAKYLPKAIIKNALEVHVVCDEWNPDYSKMVERGLISTEYGQQWHGAYAVEDSREGWAAAIVDLVDTFFRDDVRHQKRVYDVTKVRPEGAPLKSFGGSASGPAPLAVALKDMARVLSDHIGEPLTPLMAMELDHILAQCVLAGGVRRTARMSIVDWDDPFIFDFINCKSDSQSHWTTNISVGVDDRFFELMAKGVTWPESILTKVAEGMLSNGEPGFVNFGLARKTDPDVVAVNPCVSAGTWTLTSAGPKFVRDLIGKQFTAIVDGKPFDSDERGFYRTGTKEVWRVKTDAGYEIDCTPNQELYDDQGNRVKVEDLKLGDRLLLTDNFGATWGGRGSFDEGYVIGHAVGDGTFSPDGNLILASWPNQGNEVIETELARIVGAMPGRSDFNGWMKAREHLRMTKKSLTVLAMSYGVIKGNKTVTDDIESASSSFCAGFLRGIFDTDGHVEGSMKAGYSVRLSSVDLPALQGVQRMLARIGIKSSIRGMHEARMKDMPGGTYQTKKSYRLIISGRVFIQRYAEVVSFWNAAKLAKLEAAIGSYSREPYEPRFWVKFKSAEPIGVQEVYDCTIPGPLDFDGNGLRVRDCGEQFLGAWDACNLGHVNLAAFDFNDSDGLYEAHRLMARFLVRATFGDKADEKQRDAVERNRRIGVGHLGFASFLALNGIRYSDAPANDSVKFLLHMLYTEVREAADKYAYQLRIPSSLKVTTVAPTGSIAKLPGVTEGLHPPMYKWFIRRIRFSTVRPDEVRQLEEFAEQGFKIEDDLYAANTKVVEIPTEESLISDVAARGVDDPHWLVQCSTDLTADEMLAVQAMYQEHYSDSGVSCTVNVQPEELDAEELARLLAEYLPTLKGCTVFPSVSRPQSPYEEITEEEYGQSTARTVADSVDLDCSSGACPIR